MKKQTMDKIILKIQELSVSAKQKLLLNPISLDIPQGGVFGIIGPSGAGKSTFLKCINRLTETVPQMKVSGQIWYEGKEIYKSSVNPDDLRTKIGMLFQQPVIFPTSIVNNVLFGVKHLRLFPKSEWTSIAENALRQSALWDEVKDRLRKPAQQLSVGQQQRLCLARTLAMGSQVLLMDEPTSALDPKSTEAIEVLIDKLRESHTIVLVTHNMRQTERVCDNIAFIGLREGIGTMLAKGPLNELKNNSDIPEIEDYLCCETPGIVDTYAG